MVARAGTLAVAAAPALAVIGGSHAMPAETSGMGEHSLFALAEDVRARLARLREALANEPACDQVLLVLVLYLDERIMQALPADLRLGWPMLQHEWLGTTNGGDEFYRILEGVLAMPAPPRSLLEIFYFCLNSGFVGRYAGQPSMIDAWKDRLRAAITATGMPLATGAHPIAPDDAYLAMVPRPATWLYLGTVAIVIAVAVVLVLLSNHTP